MDWPIILICVILLLQETGILIFKSRVHKLEWRIIEIFKAQQTINKIQRERLDYLENRMKEYTDSLQLFLENEDEPK